MKLFITLLIYLISACQLFAADNLSPDTVLKSLLSAIENKSIEKFAKHGDEHFKAALMQESKEVVTKSGNKFTVVTEDDRFQNSMTKASFTTISRALSPRLKSGYTITYFGKLRQKGYDTYIYRVEFKDVGDDVLTTLCMKDGKVGGFWFQ